MNDALERARAVVGGARRAIDGARARVDDLNVYPVPDGDTGTNLALTVAAVADALAAAGPQPPAELAALVRRAALMGGRGNSGIILSQIVRGLCDALATADEVGEATLAGALRAASDAAYRAVRQPVEGTILTVIRAMADAAETAAGTGRLREAVLAAGEEAVARTPEQLAVLREAGVVDAGGAGLLEIVRGAFAGLAGETVAPAGDHVARPTRDPHAEPSRYRYCTSYVVAGAGVDAAALEAALAALGDSLIVVGDREGTKVHVHTDDPGRALSLATAMGGIAAVEIADMHGQIADRARRLAPVAAERRATDVVIVLQGDGNRAIAESLGARRIVAGGQSMNPSTGDLVQAIRSADADGVVVLPCNPNVLGAARAAADATGIAHVVEARSIPSGLAALVAYDPDAPAAANAAAMAGAAGVVTSAEVVRAVRGARVDGLDVAEGAWLGIVDGTAIAALPTLAEAIRAVVVRLADDEPALVTALVGDGDGDDARAVLAAVAGEHPDVEFDVRDGGQPHYAVLLGAE